MVKLGLTISKPALLLNRIAQRYSKLARILMEYVDNSLDDAETLYNRKAKAYKQNVKITITIGSDPYTVAIVDNCRGMDRKQLTRLIQNVGESMKHSRFTNGQFGFGIHAFRAAARHMRVVSKTKNKVQTLVLDIDRDSMDFTAPRPLTGFNDDNGTNKSGVQIFISEFDKEWTEGLNVPEIVNEIQYHFGALLERKNLTVTVRHENEKIICKPFDYATVQGKHIKKNLVINNSKVEVRLWISPVPVENQGCYFVAHGRRIHEIHEIKSFMKVSISRWSVWSHPNVVGYVEVGDVVEPVITRDEFRRTANRTQLYKQMVLTIEPLLAAVITKVNQRRRVLEMGRLGNILSKCFNVAVKKDSDRNKGISNYLDQMQGKRATGTGKRKLPEEWNNQDLPADQQNNNEEENKENNNGEDGNNNPENNNPETNTENKDGENTEENKEKEKDQPDAKKQKREDKMDKLKRIRSKFEMVFVNELKDSKGAMQRAILIGDQMYINVAHPDFTERVHTNRVRSKLNITERLCSYIANISANSYKSAVISRQPEGLGMYTDNQTKLFEEILDLEFSMESSLRKYLPAIQKEVGGKNEKKRKVMHN